VSLYPTNAEGGGSGAGSLRAVCKHRADSLVESRVSSAPLPPFRADQTPSSFDTIRTVGAPAPNRVGQLFPHSLQTEIDVSPSAARSSLRGRSAPSAARPSPTAPSRP